jgi:pimeloyl-ACP methyl ester carboxylesterase
MTERQWNRRGHDHGAALARDLGATPVYVRYNSGLHISTVGRELSLLIEELVAGWPAPLDDLVILAHSMGGLVARSACHAAETAELSWRGRLRKLVFLGTPHHGAPLERGGNLIDVLLGASRYSAPLARLGKIRSAGVTDMRYGNVLDEHWQDRDRFAHGPDPRHALRLPEGVSCHAVAATLSPGPAPRLRSDGLVPVESALGRHKIAALDLAFPPASQRIVYGAGHLDLLDRAEVYTTIRDWLSR